MAYKVVRGLVLLQGTAVDLAESWSGRPRVSYGALSGIIDLGPGSIKYFKYT